MAAITDYEFGISAIDSGLMRPGLDAIHLVVEQGRAALVDTGVNASLPLVLEALHEKGLRPEAVDFIILTHVHLDHAGGAGALMRALPKATLALHPRGARHMADPSRLVEGTIAVYGAEVAHRTYGEILPVALERIREMPDGARLSLAGREFVFLDTPGHARHHACILDTLSGHIFTGDTFGLSYRELDCDGRQFIFPSATPIQFDPAALHRSIDRLLALRPEAVYVTHYGQVRDIPRLGADLHRLIDAHAEMARAERAAGADRLDRLARGVTEILLGEARRYNWRLATEAILQVFAGDITLNAQGLEAWLEAGA